MIVSLFERPIISHSPHFRILHPTPTPTLLICVSIFPLLLFECLISTHATTGYSRRGSQSNYITVSAQSADRKSWKQLHKLANQRTAEQNACSHHFFLYLSFSPSLSFLVLSQLVSQSEGDTWDSFTIPFTGKNERLLFFHLAFVGKSSAHEPRRPTMCCVWCQETAGSALIWGYLNKKQCK